MSKNETEIRSELEALKRQQRGILLAARIGFSLLLLLLVGCNFKQGFVVFSYRQFFSDMLGGKPLPALTEWAFAYAQDYFFVFVFLTGLLPLLCVLYTVLSKAVTRVILLDFVMAVLLFVQWQLLSAAVMETFR